MNTLAPEGMHVWGKNLRPMAHQSFGPEIPPEAYNLGRLSSYEHELTEPVGVRGPPPANPFKLTTFTQSQLPAPDEYNQNMLKIPIKIAPNPGVPQNGSDMTLYLQNQGKQPKRQLTLDDMILVLRELEKHTSNRDVLMLYNRLSSLKIISLTRTFTTQEQKFIEEAQRKVGQMAESVGLSDPDVDNAENLYNRLETSIQADLDTREQLLERAAEIKSNIDNGYGRDVVFADRMVKTFPDNPAYVKLLEKAKNREQKSFEMTLDTARILTEKINKNIEDRNELGHELENLSVRAIGKELPQVGVFKPNKVSYPARGKIMLDDLKEEYYNAHKIPGEEEKEEEEEEEEELELEPVVPEVVPYPKLDAADLLLEAVEGKRAKDVAPRVPKKEVNEPGIAAVPRIADREGYYRNKIKELGEPGSQLTAKQIAGFAKEAGIFPNNYKLPAAGRATVKENLIEEILRSRNFMKNTDVLDRMIGVHRAAVDV